MKNELESSEDDGDDGESEDDDEEQEDLAALDDADLFMVDDPNENAASGSASESDSDGHSSDDDSDTSISDEDPNEILDVNGGRAAWIDSDDERLQVSLATNNRLKSLGNE